MNKAILFPDLQTARTNSSASPEEAELLYALVRNLKPKVCLETGTHKGYASIHIGKALEDNGEGHLWTCDPKDWGAKDLINGVAWSNRITYLQIKGKDFKSEQKIDFMFCDGFHEKEVVVEEMKSILPQLNKNAVVVFHDAGEDNEFCGVNGAVKELGLKSCWLPTQNCLIIYCHQ